MKTTLTTFALTLALCAVSSMTAQAQSSVAAPRADTVMLSETTDGDYLVRRFLVKNPADADYSVRYQINLATLSSTFDGNSRELAGLGDFIGELAKDTLSKVESVMITGYSSPDGSVKFNETLARNRAANFRNYADKKYGLSTKYAVKTTSVAEDWEMCRAQVVQMPVPDKQAVLNIIDSRQSADAKEAALKKMPAAWDYMKRMILPPLRRVEVAINYGAGRVIEQRTLIAKPAPKPEPKPETTARPAPEQEPYTVVDENITGIIVEMPAKEYRREVREAEYQTRQAEKLARKELRKARKVAKKEAKAAKKAEKMVRDAAR